MATGTSLAPLVDGIIYEVTTIALEEKRPGVLDPNIMYRLKDSLDRARAVAFGPGMGRVVEVVEVLAWLVEGVRNPWYLMRMVESTGSRFDDLGKARGNYSYPSPG